MPNPKAPTFKDPASLPLFTRHYVSEIAARTGYSELRVLGIKRGWARSEVSKAFMDAVTIAFPNETDLFTETAGRTEE